LVCALFFQGQTGAPKLWSGFWVLVVFAGGNIVVLVLFYRRSGLVLVLVDIFEFLRRKKDGVEL
jgi:hypothetical protein